VQPDVADVGVAVADVVFGGAHCCLPEVVSGTDVKDYASASSQW
jgi:hypothetical protein